MHVVLRPRLWLFRLVLGVLLAFGGLLAILPVLGLWMLPLGLILIAMDVPVLTPVAARAVIRSRWWWRRRTKMSRER